MSGIYKPATQRLKLKHDVLEFGKKELKTLLDWGETKAKSGEIEDLMAQALELVEHFEPADSVEQKVREIADLMGN